jgi:hypothetical protein
MRVEGGFDVLPQTGPPRSRLQEKVVGLTAWGLLRRVPRLKRLQLRTGFRGLDGEEFYFRFQRLPRSGLVGIDDNEPVTDFHALD